jgi:ribosomal protein S6
MNNNYEATLGLNTQGNEESVDDMLRTIESTFRKQGAEVTEIRKLEKRRLAYEPHRSRVGEGFFVVVYFSADSARISGLRSALKLDDNILITYLTKLDAPAPAATPA